MCLKSTFKSLAHKKAFPLGRFAQIKKYAQGKPQRFKAKESELHDLYKKIVSSNNLTRDRNQKRLHASAATSASAAADPQSGSKRTNHAATASAPNAASRTEQPPLQARVNHATQTQLDEVTALLAFTPNVKSLRFKMCVGTVKGKVCPSPGGSDKCPSWHHCYLCVRHGDAATDCFNHHVGQDYPYFIKPIKKPMGSK